MRAPLSLIGNLSFLELLLILVIVGLVFGPLVMRGLRRDPH